MNLKKQGNLEQNKYYSYASMYYVLQSLLSYLQQIVHKKIKFKKKDMTGKLLKTAYHIPICKVSY